MNKFFHRHYTSGRRGALLLVALLACIATPCVWQAVLKICPSAEPTLRFVSIVHRHGDRAPETGATYPLLPYKGEKYWPDGLGALLKSGKRNMYEFGQFFRERYEGFLSPTYNPVEVRVTSNDIERCITSALMVVAGLYPPVGNEPWNPDLLWEPVPVHTLTPSCDDKILVSKPCALFSKENKEKGETMEKRKLAEIGRFLPYLSENVGQEINTSNGVYFVYDYFYIVEQQGLTLPQWYRNISDEMASTFRKIYIDDEFKPTPTQLKFLTGVLINEILSNMERKANSSDNFRGRLNLYSGQDLNLMLVWHVMNFSQNMKERMPYGAALIFELHEIEGVYRVKANH